MLSKFKKIKYGKEARQALYEGVKIAKSIVLPTLGPSGSNVKKMEWGSVRNTKDGYYAIQDLNVEDDFHNMGVDILKSASSELNTRVGDNTTTVSVLTSLMVEKAYDVVLRDHDKNELKGGLEWARDEFLKILDERAIEVSADSRMIKHVATVAANGDEYIGNVISEIYHKIGSAVIGVELSKSRETAHEVVDGFEIDRGYISPYFVTDPKKQLCELEKPYVLLCNQKVSSIEDLLPVLEHVSSSGRPLLIIAEDVDGNALTTLIVNKLRGLKVAAIKAPGFGDKKTAILEDIAVLTGAQLISPEAGRALKDGLNFIGSATSAVVGKDKSFITNSEADKVAVDRRCEQIFAEKSNCSDEYDCKNLEERYSKLKCGAAVIKVGGENETHAKEKKDLVEDAVLAVRSAVEEGIVSGGGSSYSCIGIQIRSMLAKPQVKYHKDWVCGAEIFLEALSGIESAIIRNSVQEVEEKVHKISAKLFSRRTTLKNNGILNEKLNDDVIDIISQAAAEFNSSAKNTGYDARKHIIVDDMIEGGVIDSKKGVRSCVEVAVAGVLDFVFTSSLITEVSTEEKEQNKFDM